MSPFGLALLVVALAPLARPLLRRGSPMRERAGRARYRTLVMSAWWRFGIPVLLVLALTGRWRAVARTPSEFVPVQALFGADAWAPADRLVVTGAGAAGLLLGVTLGVGLTAWRAWRGRPEGAAFGDARSLLPRSPDDYGWAALVAFTARCLGDVNRPGSAGLVLQQAEPPCLLRPGSRG